MGELVNQQDTIISDVEENAKKVVHDTERA
jgi:hypothetical protein